MNGLTVVTSRRAAQLASLVRHASTATSNSPPQRTALYDLHAARGGKLVDFAGFLLPVQYGAEGIAASHQHTRSKCSLFDVSHMLQSRIHGKDRVELMERLTTADVGSLKPGHSALTLFTHHETGGILDDLIVTQAREGHLVVVSNAGRRDHDQGLLRDMQARMQNEGKEVNLEFLSLEQQSLIALQGPRMRSVLQPHCSLPLDELRFMSSAVGTVAGVADCRVTRCGYTGEDGVEISVPSSHVCQVVDTLLDKNPEELRLAGLGARDSLRLEAGLCLYGSDIDVSLTPVEASLTWLVSKTRRSRLDFPGHEVIMRQLKEGVSKKRVGIKMEKGPPARHNCRILTTNGDAIGHVTSGCPSPTLGGSVAMAYVDPKQGALGAQVLVEVRGKTHSATVVKMPFVERKYYTG